MSPIVKKDSSYEETEFSPGLNITSTPLTKPGSPQIGFEKDDYKKKLCDLIEKNLKMSEYYLI